MEKLIEKQSFLKEYKEILNIIRVTNEFYLQCLRTLKKIFLIVIYITIFLTILTVGIIVYITSPRCRKYNMLIDEKDENNDNNKNKDINGFLNLITKKFLMNTFNFS